MNQKKQETKRPASRPATKSMDSPKNTDAATTAANEVSGSGSFSSSSQKSRKKKRTGKKLFFLILAEVIILLLLVPFIFLFLQFTRIHTADIETEHLAICNQDENMDDYINLMFFGVDSRDNELTENTRSDSMILVSINKKNSDIRLVSFFRDCYVFVDGHGYTKLTHAYSYGGPELALNTINQNFDLNVKDFVTVNFSALTNVIDALGGVEIKITEDEIDYVNSYTRDVARINGTTPHKIRKAGKQTLDGTQATAYCRVRYTAGGDFTRAQRQRTVLYAIARKAKKSNPIALLNVVKEIMPQVYTSLHTGDLLKLSLRAFSYDIKKDTGYPFDNKVMTVNSMSVVIPETVESNVTRLHKFLFRTKNYVPSARVMEISAGIPF